MNFSLISLCMLFMLSVASANTVPAKVLDLSAWKLTLPIIKEGNKNAVEVKQPQLASFSNAGYFFSDEGDKAVVFRAACGGNTTPNSKYPRCELREMTSDGKGRASWETDSKLAHTMTMRVAVTHTPVVKPHVVCAQIHDSGDDLIMIRLEGKHLFVERKPFEDVSINRNYKLGTPFDLKIEAKNGRVKVWCDGDEKMDWEVSAEGCYFKAGCYTQSNIQKGDNEKAYGEVKIYSLEIKHEE
jgi:hypothetical protein